MVRPASFYRSPRQTMDLLRAMVHHFGDQVEAIIFGAKLDDPEFRALPQDFRFQLAGVLSQKQVARLLNEVDVFVDFSSHQAMGLTAMEAMACGAAVIVPLAGGAETFAVHGMNSLVVDTNSQEDCAQALHRLVEDEGLRRRLQAQALRDICQFYVERPAYNILNTLFSSRRQ